MLQPQKWAVAQLVGTELEMREKGSPLLLWAQPLKCLGLRSLLFYRVPLSFMAL